MTNPTALAAKLWNDCSILRGDGLSYGDCVEQLVLPEGCGHRSDGQS